MDQVDGHAAARRALGRYRSDQGGLEYVPCTESAHHEATAWIDPRAEQAGARFRLDEQPEADGHPHRGKAHRRTRRAAAAPAASAAAPRSPWCCEAQS